MDPLYSRSVWQSILDDPNTSQGCRDIAHSQLRDPIGMGTRADAPAEVSHDQTLQNKKPAAWQLVEAFEYKNWNDQDQGPAEVITLAAHTILTTEETNHKVLPLNAMMSSSGKPSVKKAYPKLVAAAENAMQSRTCSAELKADAHIVMSCFERQSGGSISSNHLRNAVKTYPKDWRLRSSLATQHIKGGNASMSLECLIAAEALAPDASLSQWNVRLHKGKVLYNLSRQQEAAKTLELVLQDFETTFKKDPGMSDRTVGQLAVAQYMLCQIYVLLDSGNNKKNYNLKIKQNFYQAEDKRSSMDLEAAKKIDWGNRTITQMFVSRIDPFALSHGECHVCAVVTDKPLKCTACKTAQYCGRACQGTAWKHGHKQECASLKDQRKTDTKQQKKDGETNQAVRQVASKLPPLDANLDPKKLWKDALQLSKKKKHQDAAFNFLVALFMDFSLDASDMAPVKATVDACANDDPVAMALSILTHMDRSSPLRRASDMHCKSMLMWNAATEPAKQQSKTAKTLDDVNRWRFGIGMCVILCARVMGRCYAVRNSAEANSPEHRQAFEDMTKLVNESKSYVDAPRWLTLQFELAYINMDVAAVEEAKLWFGIFMANLDAMRQRGSVSLHWRKFRVSAEKRIAMIPMFERAMKNGTV